MNKKIGFIFIPTIFLFLFVLLTAGYTFYAAAQLEKELFSCLDYPDKCPQNVTYTSVDFQQMEKPDIVESIFNFLTEESGYLGVRFSAFDATPAPWLVPPYTSGSGLSGGDDHDGYEPLVCPENVCYEYLETIILVDSEPVIRIWAVERDNLSLSSQSLILTGVEQQSLLVVPGAAQVVGLAENPSLLNRARSNEENFIWHKQFRYEIVCTLTGCIKTYE